MDWIKIKNAVKKGLLGASLAVALGGCAGSLENKVAEAPDEASTAGLITAGIGMALADFLLQTLIHEGSHAIAVKMVGGELNNFEPYPHFYEDKEFVFGSMNYDHDLTPQYDALISMVPKLTDLIILSSYAVLLETDSLPKNKYARLAIWIFAFGAEVDLVKDLCTNICYDNPNNDLIKFKNNLNYGNTGDFAVRGTIFVLSALAGYELYRGLEDIFNPQEKALEDSPGTLTVGPGAIGYRVDF